MSQGTSVLNMVAAGGARRARRRRRWRASAGDVPDRRWQRLHTMALPAHHHVSLAEIDPNRLGSVLLATYERQPEGL